MTDTKNSLQVVDAQVVDLPRNETSSAALILSDDSMDRALRFADLMASGRATVPQHLQKNSGDCLAITIQAMQWRMNPFAVAQKTHVVSGALGYEAQLVNAVIVTSGAIVGRPDYEWEGDWKNVDGKASKDDKLAVTVSATIRGEDAVRALRVSMAQVGSVRNSPLWVSDPRQQLAYLALKRWSRLHTPDVMLGVYTPDELEERAPVRNMGRAEVVHSAPAAPSPALVKEAEAAAAAGLPAYQKFWKDTGDKNRALLRDTHHERLKAEAEANAPAAPRAARAAPAAPAAAPAAEATPAADTSPALVASDVYQALQDAYGAGDLDGLDAVSEQIADVADEKQRLQLTAEYNALAKSLETGSAQ